MDRIDLVSLTVGICGLVGFIFSTYDKVFHRGGKERNLEDRVATLEKNNCEINTKLDTIMTNHLPHIQDKISKINNNLTEINTTLKFIIKEK